MHGLNFGDVNKEKLKKCVSNIVDKHGEIERKNTGRFEIIVKLLFYYFVRE